MRRLRFPLRATTSDGEDVYDRELLTFAPRGTGPVQGITEISPKTRAAALATRRRVLRAHPDWKVQICEVPVTGDEAVDDVFEGLSMAAYVLSLDGETFVLPGAPNARPSRKRKLYPGMEARSRKAAQPSSTRKR